MKNTFLILFVFLLNLNGFSQKISVPDGISFHVSDNVALVLSDGMNLELNSENTSFNGNIIFAGNETQTISGTIPVIFDKLTVDNGNMLLENDLTVNNELNMLNGIIDITDKLFIIGEDAVLSGNFSNNCMIVKNESGVFQRNVSSNNLYLFPVGNISGTSDYSPAEIEITNATYDNASINIAVTNSKFSENTSVNNYLNRYWEINQTGISNPEYHIDLTYLPSDIIGNEDEIYGAYYQNGWHLLNPVSNNKITADINELGVFTGGEQSAFSSVDVIFNDEIKISGVDDGFIVNAGSGIDISNIIVFNVLGQKVYQQKEFVSGEIRFNKSVSSGIFFIQLVTNRGTYTKKVFIY